MNWELVDRCLKFKELPIIIVAETMADIFGFVSVYGRVQYCGDSCFENEELVCLGKPPEFLRGECYLTRNYVLRFSSNIETFWR